MLELPQKNFRGKQISFEQFFDLLIVGMAGLTDGLMKGEESPFQYGMVNYRLIAENLGLLYEPEWIEMAGHDFENSIEAIASHDIPETGNNGNISWSVSNGDGDSTWVYLNSGFTRIAELLFEKYYDLVSTDLTTSEVGDAIIFELAGLVEQRILEDGSTAASNVNLSYNLINTANWLDMPFSEKQILQAATLLVECGYLKGISETNSTEEQRYELTANGYEYIQRISDSDRMQATWLSVHGHSNLYFSVDASHISRLGLELVAKQETAVAELVKNGYDADATSVDLILQLDANQTTEMEIFDNGTGMTIGELEDGFMRISTASKVSEPTSRKYLRQKAGRKGIGRFAAQRLGNKLSLETTTENLHYALRLEIDWDKFQANTALSSVPSTIRRVPKSFPHGTKLRIQGLRDRWSNAQIIRAHRHVAELIQPFPLAEVDSSSNQDPGFSASFAKVIGQDIEIIADDWSLYFQHALAEIEGSVDKKGNGSWKISSKRFDIENEPNTIGLDEASPPAPYKFIKDVKFKAYYFIDKETQKAFRSKVAEKLQSSGGIRLYRNGFRVLPYGERFDDWLKLNASNLLRKILPPHSNRNFLGFVEINDVDGTLFEETSSREGLVENEAFKELEGFISGSLKMAILPIADARDRKRTTTDTRQKLRSPRGQADDIKKKLENLKVNSVGNPEYAAALASVVDMVSQSVSEIGETGEDLLQELGMTRVLASLGLAIGEFTHEIRLALESVKASASLLGNSVENPAAAKKGASQLFDKLTDFEGYLTYFDSTVRDNVSRDVCALEIRDVVHSFTESMSPKVRRNELEIKTEYDGYALYMIPMHKSEWGSILVNLLTNSLKAIRRAGAEGQILISCGRQNGNIYLNFSDNGDGIPNKIRERVFDPFFTTTSTLGSVTENDTLAGMGMGLKILKDIVTTVGGTISLHQAPKGYVTCFRVEIPEASEEDIPQDDY